MQKISVWFLAAASACLVVGTGLGVVMGISHDFRLAPVHAHLNLLGWTSLALMGLTYRAWPELARSRTAALTQFALSAGSAAAFPPGIWLAIAHESSGLAIVAALVWLAGALLFLVRVLVLAWTEDRAGAPAFAAAE